MDPANITSPYGYTPTKYVTIIFVVLSSISTLIHVRYWIRFGSLSWPIIACGILEITGWASRLESSISPGRLIPYKTQLAVTLVGPTVLAHANMALLSAFVEKFTAVV